MQAPSGYCNPVSLLFTVQYFIHILRMVVRPASCLATVMEEMSKGNPDFLIFSYLSFDTMTGLASRKQFTALPKVKAAENVKTTQ